MPKFSARTRWSDFMDACWQYVLKNGLYEEPRDKCPQMVNGDGFPVRTLAEGIDYLIADETPGKSGQYRSELVWVARHALGWLPDDLRLKVFNSEAIKKPEAACLIYRSAADTTSEEDAELYARFKDTMPTVRRMLEAGELEREKVRLARGETLRVALDG